MLGEMFSFEQPDSAQVPDKYSSSMGSNNGEGGNLKKQTRICEGEDWGKSGDTNALCSGVACYEEENNTAEKRLVLSKNQHEPQGQMFQEIGCLDMYFDIVSPPFHSCDEEIRKLVDRAPEPVHVIESEQEKVPAFRAASLKLLTTYASRFKRLNMPSYETECTKLSTDAILRLAGEKFIRSPAQSGNELFVLSHPFSSSFLSFSEEDKRDLELVYYLLASAEKVGEKQFDRARKLLQECDKLSSCKGDPVQRLVYYFSEALHKKIGKEIGKPTSSGNLWKNPLSELQEALMSPNRTILAFHQVVPFSQVTQFAGIQAIVEHVSGARKIHIIDLAIRCGTHLIILIQALAARNKCPLEHLKVTAVGTESKPKIEETGRRLMSFAQSLNLQFSFDVIMVDDIQNLNKSLLSIDSDEVVAIYSAYFLMNMIAQPDRLESLMRVIRNINPRIMIVNEVEGNHNSPVFVNRFIETLFFYGAFFDSLEDCMKHDEPNRVVQESFYFSKGIRNIVAAEGEERTMRHVSINVWRAFFARFGMMEMEMSMSSVYHANLVLKNFSCGSSCTVDMDGKSLIIGWKGTPIHSLSAWKFADQDADEFMKKIDQAKSKKRNK